MALKTLNKITEMHFEQMLEVFGAPASAKKLLASIKAARDEANDMITEANRLVGEVEDRLNDFESNKDQMDKRAAAVSTAEEQIKASLVESKRVTGLAAVEAEGRRKVLDAEAAALVKERNALNILRNELESREKDVKAVQSRVEKLETDWKAKWKKLEELK